MLRLISKKNKVLFLILVIFILNNYTCFAYSTEPVKAIVKSSVCGNDIVEGGEECDNNDLSCDSSCHLNYSAPTKIPNNSQNNIQNNFFNFSAKKIFPIKIEENKNPLILSFFGFNKYQKFGKDEIFNIVKMWIDEEKKEKGSCDINNDSKCDAQDFSILLYYMKK